MIRRLTAVLCIALALLLGAAPAWAGTARFEIQAQVTTTVSSNSGGVSVRDLREILVFVSCLAASGTGETLDLYVQSSSDGGTTWYDIPADVAEEMSAVATEGTTTANKRDILELAADDACVNAVGKYTVFGDYIRIRWLIAGTTPSYTFSVKAIGKT